MNTQQFILELAEKLGADAKTVVILVFLVVPLIHWICGLLLVPLVTSAIKAIITVAREPEGERRAFHEIKKTCQEHSSPMRYLRDEEVLPYVAANLREKK